MSYKGITKEDLETMRKNGLSFTEEQQLFWEKEDYLEVDKDKEIERLNSIIKEIREYIEKNTQWYDKELGLVEMEGYNSNRIPVVYLYGLLEILDKLNKEE